MERPEEELLVSPLRTRVAQLAIRSHLLAAAYAPILLPVVDRFLHLFGFCLGH